ncbi:MAG TPA: LCP family protein [Jiangellales bacterium]|nr:LCP family protein [Jiangellales bacterium]
MPEAAEESGRRRARLDARRQQRSSGYGRFLGFTALGTLIPGAGLVAAGRRRIGAFVLALVGLVVVAGVVVYLTVPTSRLAAIAGDRERLALVGAVVGVVAVLWLLIAVVSHHLLEPRGLGTGRRLIGALVVVAVATTVLGPLAVASRYAFVQRDLVSTITLSDRPRVSLTAPDDVEKEDPWATKPRVNVLLLGGDDGGGSEGRRTDTVILASIDTHTGDTVLFSLPRNLTRVPFEDGSALHDVYPSGFSGPDDEAEYFLNAVYQNAPALHPEIFEGLTDPGADAVKMAVGGALGIPVDYYVAVNLTGFSTLIDALGGITVNVRERLPIGNKLLANGRCSQPSGWVEAGENQTLDGWQALWFARSRCTTDDYDRMRRQRCVMGAIIDQADPVNVLRRYEAVAGATKDIVSTDIPEDLLPAFIELSLRVKDAQVTSLPFTSEVINTGNPDYALMQQMVQQALNPPPPAPSPTDAATDEPTEPAPAGEPVPSPTPTISEADGAVSLDAVC